MTGSDTHVSALRFAGGSLGPAGTRIHVFGPDGSVTGLIEGRSDHVVFAEPSAGAIDPNGHICVPDGRGNAHPHEPTSRMVTLYLLLDLIERHHVWAGEGDGQLLVSFVFLAIPDTGCRHSTAT